MRQVSADHTLGRWGRTRVALFVLVPALAVFAFHVRWIFGHFSHDGYLCDSGWIAFLLGEGDPWLRNPRAVVGEACAGINAPTFLAHHLSPHLFLFGTPFALVGVSGIAILAYHQGLFFALLSAGFLLVAATPALGTHDRLVAVAIAAAVGTIGNPLLQAAAYPHYETAIVGTSILAIAAWVRDIRPLFIACLLWLPVIREDGGLYVAVVCLACLTVDYGEHGVHGRRAATLAGVAAVGIAIALLAFLVRATCFPGFEAFSKNFAGNRWSHVTAAFVLERARATLTNWNIAPVLLGSTALAAFDRRYLTGVVLLAPLLLVHMLSVRPEHGRFTLYYALPFLLPVVIWLFVLVRRMASSSAGWPERLLAIAASLALTTPVQAIVGAPQQQWLVVEQGFTRAPADIPGMIAFARSVRASSIAADRPGRHCGSMGIAALIPDDLAPADVIDPARRLSECRTLLLLRSDMHYRQLVAAATAAGFRLELQRDTAELWMHGQR